MKRLIIPIIILAAFTNICFGQEAGRRTRASRGGLIQLPQPRLTGSVSVEQALAKRRSIRRFTGQGLSLSEISQLAWAAQGITNGQRGFRTAPSARAIYPIRIYLATPEGLFFYHPHEHSLERTNTRDIRRQLSDAALGQQVVAQGECIIILAGASIELVPDFGHQAGSRFLLMEAGHIAQNVLLQAVGMGLGAVPVGSFDLARIGRICEMPTNLEPLYIICVGHATEPIRTEKIRKKGSGQMKGTKTKKAAMIIASNNFRDEELFETKRQLEEANITTVIASTKKSLIKGILGGKAKAEILVDEINVDDYDAIIFVGGSGARQYFENHTALNIARQAKEKGKILGAICIAPTILSNAGILNGVRVTSYPSEENRLKKAGAKYTGTNVEQDGLIITGKGPQSATQFGITIAEALAKK
jgi:protease I